MWVKSWHTCAAVHAIDMGATVTDTLGAAIQRCGVEAICTFPRTDDWDAVEHTPAAPVITPRRSSFTTVLASLGSWRLSPPPSPDEAHPPPPASFDLPALLLWREPRRTARIGAAGLYTLICLQQLAHGALPLQPLSLACGALLVWLLTHIYRHGSAEAPTTNSRALEDALAAAMHRAARATAPVLASTVVCTKSFVARSKGATAVLIASLWLLLGLSELRVASQWALLCCAWLMLFSVPVAYVHMREAVDHHVERWWRVDALNPSTMTACDARRLCAGAAGAIVVFALLYDLSIVARLSLAAVAFAGASRVAA